MFGFGLPELMLILTLVVGFILPAWFAARVARKAGFSWLWAIPAIIPVFYIYIVTIWVFAFVPWPAIDRAEKGEEKGDKSINY